MSSAATVTQIIEYLKTGFIHTDNITVDYAVSKEIVMKATASLAIEANYGSLPYKRRLDPTKIKKSLIEGQDAYVLSPEMKYRYSVPINITKRFYNNPATITYYAAWNKLYFFRVFIVDTNTCPYTWKPYMAGDVINHLGDDKPPSPYISRSVDNCYIYMIHTDANNTGKPEILWNADYENIRNAKDDIIKHFERTYSKYELYKSISSVKSPEEVLALFSLGDNPYVHVKERIHNYHRDNIAITSEQDSYFRELYSNSRGKPYEVVLNSFLYDFCVKSLTRAKIGFCLEQVFRAGKYQAVFPFRDRFEYTNMAVVKCYCPDTSSKFFVPVTAWICEKTNSIVPVLTATACVPFPGKQPLFNLDKLSAEGAKTVIITDSLDIASLNQKNHSLPGLVFTSFLCHEDNYDQVDWSPLIDENNNIKRLLLLVTNHSGYSLEQAYEKAKKLSEYLSTHVLVKHEGLQIEFVQLEVRYDSAKHNNQHFNEWINHLEDTYTDDPMRSVLVDVQSVMHLNSFEFEDMYSRSQITLKRFWENEDMEDEPSSTSESQQVSQKPPVPYLMRPLIVRGKRTMIYGPKACGKSFLSLSIAMAIVNADAERPKHIFPEVLWRVNKPRQNNIKYHKVLYLDFELDKDMHGRIEQMAKSLWGGKAKECEPNMIIKDMKSSGNLDFSSAENHHKVFELLEEAKSQGIKGQPVDMLVIDPYTRFVKKDDADRAESFTDLCNALYARDKNLAILVVHHANRNKVPRGSGNKLDSIYTIFSIELIDNKKSISDPRKYSYLAYNGSDTITDFTGRLAKDNSWVVDTVEGYDKPDEQKMLIDVCKNYKSSGFRKSAMATMLGVSENTLTKELKGN